MHAGCSIAPRTPVFLVPRSQAMELLRFPPAQSPLPSNHATATSRPALCCSRKPTRIYATLSSKSKEINAFSVQDVVLPNSLTVLTSPPAEQKPKPLLTVSPNSLAWESGRLLPNDNLGIGAAGNGAGSLSAVEYLTSILSANVYDVAYETPLQLATKLSESWGINLWLKREDLQPVFSFKIRGAYNMMTKLPKEQLEIGVICSSAGNHAQGVALSAQKLGCNAVIVMPVATPEIKCRSVERLGATVVLVGNSYAEAQAYAKQRAIEEGRTFIPGFDHPDVIIGQGTVGMEIMKQMKDPIEAIFVPVGGGGLIAGIAAYVKMVSPTVKIIGVEPFEANTLALSLHHGQRVMLDKVGCFAEGVAIEALGEETFRLCRELIDGVVLVSRDAICASIKDMYEEKRSILEPAGGLALAGAEAYCNYYGLKGANVVAVTSGANMNFDRLRLVTQLADVGRRQEAVLATYMPEEPGSFKLFCELVRSMNISEFKYRFNPDKEDALVLYSVLLHTEAEVAALVERMESSELRTFNLTKNDVAKDHLRHFMGGRANVKNELLCHFIFPERPGTVMKFLDAFSPRWNITLFHYRGQGDTGTNVLVGIQVAESDMVEFHERANGLGYVYDIETSNEAFHLLMR